MILKTDGVFFDYCMNTIISQLEERVAIRSLGWSAMGVGVPTEGLRSRDQLQCLGLICRLNH